MRKTPCWQLGSRVVGTTVSPRIKDGNFFIDQPIELFLPMINFLRHKQSETPLGGKTYSPALHNFSNDHLKYGDLQSNGGVFFLALTPAIYPVVVADCTTERKRYIVVSGPSSSLKIFFTEWKIITLCPC